MSILKKKVSIDDVARNFTLAFLDNIDNSVNELIDLIEKNDKLKIPRDDAGDYLFFCIFSILDITPFQPVRQAISRQYTT